MDRCLCFYCEDFISFDDSDYVGCEEEKTYSLVKCPNCEKVNSVFYRISLDWFMREPTKEDIEIGDFIEEEHIKREI